DVAGALRTAEELPEGSRFAVRELAIAGVVAQQAARGELAGARATASRIKDPSMRDQALVAPIRAQARTDVPGALTMARALGDRTARASAVQAVVMRQARDAGVPAA